MLTRKQEVAIAHALLALEAENNALRETLEQARSVATYNAERHAGFVWIGHILAAALASTDDAEITA